MHRFYVCLFSLFSFLIAASAFAIDPADSRVGVILGTVVRVRESPNLNSAVVTTVAEGEYVEILEWTDIEQEIGNFKDRWVKIRTATHKNGFLFGAFVFELRQLYKEWNFDTCSGLLFSIKFTDQDEFEFYEGCAEPECDLKELKTRGKFVIQGRRIKLSGCLRSAHSYFSTIDEFYLFRYKGENILMELTKLDIEEIPEREKEMGGCWGWR